MKYAVYGEGAFSIYIGTYEAETEKEACEMADSDKQANWYPSLCYQCSKEIELSDIEETNAFENSVSEEG